MQMLIIWFMKKDIEYTDLFLNPVSRIQHHKQFYLIYDVIMN